MRLVTARPEGGASQPHASAEAQQTQQQQVQQTTQQPATAAAAEPAAPEIGWLAELLCRSGCCIVTNQDEARAQVQSAKAITMAPISITLAACYVELVILVGRTIHYQKRSPRMALQSERERERFCEFSLRFRLRAQQRRRLRLKSSRGLRRWLFVGLGDRGVSRK